MATTTLSPAKPIVALSTDLNQMVGFKVWDSMMCGAGTIVRATSACENTALVNHENIV